MLCFLLGPTKFAELNLLLGFINLCHMQACSDTASSRRHSLDLHELMKSSSPSWPRQSLNAKEEDRESKSGEWIDKHEELLIQDENPISPEKFYQSVTPQHQSLYVTHIALTNNIFYFYMYLYIFLFFISTIFPMTEMVGNKISKCRVLQITNLKKAQQAIARILI